MTSQSIVRYPQGTGDLSPWGCILRLGIHPQDNLTNSGWGCIPRLWIHPQGILAAHVHFKIHTGYKNLDNYILPPSLQAVVVVALV